MDKPWDQTLPVTWSVSQLEGIIDHRFLSKNRSLKDRFYAAKCATVTMKIFE